MTTIEKLPLTETVNNHMFRSDPMLALKALDTLFHPGEFVWVTDDLNRACFSIPVAEAKQWVGRQGSNGIFLAGNPAIAPGVARSNSSAIPRTFLIEFDKYPKGHPLDGQVIPLDVQEALMEDSGIPWTTKIFSGGKSFHYLVSLAEPVDTATFKQKFFWMSHRLGKMNDQGCSDPCRWSRFPGAFRGDIEQRIIEVRFPVLLKSLPGANGLKKDDFKQDWFAEPKNGDRSEIIEMLHWYCGEHGIEYTPNGVDLPCPACRAEGRDNHGDNFRIFGEDLIAKCWAGDRQHSHEALSMIAKAWHDAAGNFKVNTVDLAKAYPNQTIGSLTKFWRDW